jgi:hypothetical protein
MWGFFLDSQSENNRMATLLYAGVRIIIIVMRAALKAGIAQW